MSPLCLLTLGQLPLSLDRNVECTRAVWRAGLVFAHLPLMEPAPTKATRIQACSESDKLEVLKEWCRDQCL